MGKSKKTSGAPTRCKACNSPNLDNTGFGEYTCYKCGHVMHVKTDEQAKL